MSNTYFYKRNLYPKGSTVSELKKCAFEDCGFMFKQKNKVYCPTHADLVRAKNHQAYEKRQSI